METKKVKTVSIIIPAYNEEGTVKNTVDKVIKAKSLGLKKEIIIVNDGSSDNTSKIIKSVVKVHLQQSIKIVIVDKKKNCGKGAALRSGFQIAKGDIILIQDADLEYNPYEYELLLEPIVSGYADVVYGSRFISNKPHRVLYFWHTIGNKFLTLFSNTLTNLNLTDMETGYKVFNKDVIKKILPRLKSDRFGFEPEVTARVAKLAKNDFIRIYEVGISYFGRTYKEGKKINWKDGLKAFWYIIKFNFAD